MIYTTQTLKNKYKDYSNINQKISLENKKNTFTYIKRGLYSDNIKVDGPILANICLSPSYISFEKALSYYGLIPEYVSRYTSASFNKKNNKVYVLDNISFSYRDIPSSVFKEGIIYLKNEDNIRYKIANKEKALCDELYSYYPVRSIKDLKILLFEDLRINEEMFFDLDFEYIKFIAPLYHKNTLNALVKYIKEIERNENRN